MTKEYKNYINGKWVASSSGEIFENTNPANCNEVLGRFQKSNKKDVDKAVAAAAKAKKMWRETPAPKRGEIMYKVAELLVKHKESLAQDMTKEMGKVIAETRGDVQEAIDLTYFAAGEGRRMAGETVPSELKNKFAMSVRMPLGVVACITPWNFPLAIPSWKLIPALICGNTAVIKPAEDTPLTVVNFMDIFEKAGLPPGVVNMVTGYGPDAGAPLVEHKDVDMVSFTGSTQTGAGIASACAQRMKQYSLEMGGKNAIIIMDDANLNLALEGVMFGAFGTTGQRCTACSRVVIHKKVAKKFTDMLVERAKKLKLGNGLDEKVDMGPLINDRAREKVHRYVEIGKEEGAKLLTGGSHANSKVCKSGYFYQPTVFTDVESKMRIAQEEIFGPVVSILACNSFEEAVDIVNDSTYGLSSAIYTQDVNRAFKAIELLETGLTYVNASTIGAEIQLPFGGIKGTGNGHREVGIAALETFSEWKSVFVDYSGKLQKAQIDHD
ncbi:aldehyde dehydrogenase family protein [Nitrospina gracilis]|uniref:aldehyde dehydrogenase family protein n=1 Tax=Nitrospina gracilis TaxID=35801 RepID=UPI001F390860|nr:aldehyde dehydrogenase family protein [Nitrospina gracilis]MCF8721860.1 aldehyde dehydrogenase (NAD+) [Nitrospina gracilis Nb-211]